MMTTGKMPTETSTDADLVAECMAGSRSAFCRIVERYQGLVCSLAYSATGSLSQSEDLAQEAFVQAWKQLPQLRDRSKLRAWLCSIVRFRASKNRRRFRREPAHAAESLESLPESVASGPLPPDYAISREEEAILWRSLERIPENYREPLVLFYREHQSVEAVAAALDLSQDAVKQRLSRGRKLLHREVLAFVEGALQRTMPGKTFSVAVAAALPALAPPAKAATLGAAASTAEGSAAAKGGAILSLVAPCIAVIGAFTGGLFAIRGRVQNARSERERQFLLRGSWGILAWKGLLLITLVLVMSRTGGMVINSPSDALLWSMGWVGLYSIWIAYSIWMARRQRYIQIEEGTFEASAACRYGTVDPGRKGFGSIVYGGLATLLFGPGGLLLLLAGLNGDTAAFGLLFALAVAAWWKCARIILRHPARLLIVFAWAWWGLALVTLVTFNLRFHCWAQNPAHIWPENPSGFHLPPPWLNVPIIAFYGSIGLGWWLQRRLAIPRVTRSCS